MRVLVTDGSSKASLAMVRSLGRAGHWVGVVSRSDRSLAGCSRYCRKTHTLPSLDEDCFAEGLADLMRTTPYDVVIPQGYTSTAALARHRARFAAQTRFVVADEDKIRSAADKAFVYKLASTLNLPVPWAFCPSCWEAVAEVSGQLRYPVVIKPRWEAPADVHPRYARDRRELFGAYVEFCKQKGSSETNVLIQEYVPGYGCGFFALYQNGIGKRIFMHRRIRENPPTGKVSACAESFCDARLKDSGSRLLDSLEWHGVAMVEFRYDVRDKDYKLLEINPRFWGSLDLAVAAGVDFPNDVCKIALGETLEFSDRYAVGLRYHWLLEDIRHLWKRRRSWADILRDSLNPRVQSDLWLRDIRPNVYQVFAMIRSLVRKSKHLLRFSGRPMAQSRALPS